MCITDQLILQINIRSTSLIHWEKFKWDSRKSKYTISNQKQLSESMINQFSISISRFTDQWIHWSVDHRSVNSPINWSPIIQSPISRFTDQSIHWSVSHQSVDSPISRSPISQFIDQSIHWAVAHWSVNSPISGCMDWSVVAASSVLTGSEGSEDVTLGNWGEFFTFYRLND